MTGSPERLKGWRKHKSWRSSLKSSLRSTGKACASSSKNKKQAIENEVKEYLRFATELSEKIKSSSLDLYNSVGFDVILLSVHAKQQVRQAAWGINDYKNAIEWEDCAPFNTQCKKKDELEPGMFKNGNQTEIYYADLKSGQPK